MLIHSILKELFQRHAQKLNEDYIFRSRFTKCTFAFLNTFIKQLQNVYLSREKLSMFVKCILLLICTYNPRRHSAC